MADSWWDYAAHARVPASDEALLATTLGGAGGRRCGMRVAVVAMTRAHAALFAGTAAARLYFGTNGHSSRRAARSRTGCASSTPPEGREGAHDAGWMAVNAAAGAPPLRTLRYDPTIRGSFWRSTGFALRADGGVRYGGPNWWRANGWGRADTADLLCRDRRLGGAAGIRDRGALALMQQMVLQLDRRLENLWNQLARAVGENGFNLVVWRRTARLPSRRPERAPAWR